MTYFEEYELGSSRQSHGRTVTETDIVLHAGQTGDFYPHHMDAEFAKTLPGGQRIAHGTLILSMAVGMLAGEINDKAMSYGYDRVRFVRPVHIGDTITSRSEIVALRDHTKQPDGLGIVDEKVEVVNQRGEVVIAFVHVYLVNRRAKEREQMNDALSARTDDRHAPAPLEAVRATVRVAGRRRSSRSTPTSGRRMSQADVAAAGITATVLVQAADTYEDTFYMLSVAAACPSCAGVVAWAPLDRPDEAQAAVDLYSVSPLVRGIRVLNHNYADPRWLLRGRRDARRSRSSRRAGSRSTWSAWRPSTWR